MSSNCRTDLKCPLCGSCCIDENISDYGGKEAERMQADGGWAELQCGACKGLQTAGVGLEAEEYWIKIYNAIGGGTNVVDGAIPGGCQELKKRFDLHFSCCDSCHDDFDGGWEQPMELEVAGNKFLVCCAAKRALEDSKK